MKHYMLFLREDLDAARQMTEEQIQEDIQIMIGWVEELSRSGHYISGEPLEPEMRLSRKDRIISDGPFIETKEAIGGYIIIQANDLDQAAEIAQRCPLLGKNVRSIETRPILKY